MHTDALSPDEVRALTVDLAKLKVRFQDTRQPLIRAIGLGRRNPIPPTVIDATAGLGEDAWLLAAFGCRVIAIERHPILAALFTDALARAAVKVPKVAERITVLHANAIDVLHHLSEPEKPEVVYLDPMFPDADQRKSAERKPMRLLRRLVGGDEDADALLAAAVGAATRRVVVKRPLKAPPLAAHQYSPTTTHKGNSVRYDVYSIDKK